jgi:hypothetical protein
MCCPGNAAGLLAAGAALAEAPPLDLRVAGTTFEPSQPVGWEIWFGFISKYVSFYLLELYRSYAEAVHMATHSSTEANGNK